MEDMELCETSKQILAFKSYKNYLKCSITIFLIQDSSMHDITEKYIFVHT